MKKYGKPPCIFKVSITGSQYSALIHKYREDQIKRMHYIYFDTSLDFETAQLLKRNMRLRVRVKNGKCSLELKIKTVEIQELKQKISDTELSDLFQGNLPEGKIKQVIGNMSGKIMNIKTANTTRAKKDFEGGLLVLDKTICRGRTYFQIEFRSYDNRSKTISDLSRFKRKLGLIKKAAIITKLMFIWCA